MKQLTAKPTSVYFKPSRQPFESIKWLREGLCMNAKSLSTICHFVRPGSLKAAGLVIFCRRDLQSPTPRSIKNVEPVLLPVPQCKGLRIARLIETSNDESPTQNVIVTPLRIHLWLAKPIRIYTIRAVYKHPKGRPRCLVFDQSFEVAKFLHCQNQGVRKRLCP